MELQTGNDHGGTALGEAGTASCRLDWLSVSFFAASDEVQREQLAYFFQLLGYVADGATFETQGVAKFFSHSLSHPAGLGIKWTSPNEEGLNRGLVSVDLRGTAFTALDREDRKAIYLDIAEMEGFKSATRMDFQRTVLEPQASAEDILKRVQERTAWIKGFSSYSSPGDFDRGGAPINGATIYWGSPRSAVRCRSYNKAAESGWSTPAVRHEVQTRKAVARDRFNDLVGALRLEQTSAATAAENQFVQAVLNQHMEYLDTTRLAKLNSREDWPKNWAANSDRADFWDEVVTGHPKEMKTRWRLSKRIEESVQHCDKQYGRVLAKQTLLRIYRDGLMQDDAFQERVSQWFVRLKDEDLAELLPLIPPERREEFIEEFPEWRQVGAHNVEAFSSP